MQQHDAFVLACKQDTQGDMDGIPVVLMEAMSQQMPVVSRDSRYSELVVHEQTGLLAEPDNAVNLSQQIARLIEGPGTRKLLAAQAQMHVDREFGQTGNIDRLLKIINP
jgi:glycosyltransferase involved in cell wall biosynthesis